MTENQGLLPLPLLSYVAKQVDLDWSERRKKFAISCNHARAQLLSRGAGRGSAEDLTLAELAGSELKVCSEELLRIFFRAAIAFDVRYRVGLIDAALALLRPCLDAAAKNIGAGIPRSPLPAIVASELQEVLDRQRGRIEVALQLWEATLAKTELPAAGSTVVNVTGNGNVVQAGLYSSTASLNVDSAAKSAVDRALSAVENALPLLAANLEVDRVAITELIAECRTEISLVAPKQTKIVTYMRGLAGSIQTVAAARPAYEAIRDALSIIGVAP